MLAAALIVFREVLEAALIVTVILAATRGLHHRGRWVGIGIGGGLLGASAVAALAGFISSAFNGAGQEIVNAGILFIAVCLIAWHVIWMNSHGRKLAAELRETARSVMDGERHLSILAVVIGLAVMREGSEVVLMLQGLWASGETSAMIGGGLIGLALGILSGALIYAGFLRLSVSRLFATTNFILVLIAAGMAARAANFLSQADLLPMISPQVWDTSFILRDDSIPGRALGALVGYIAQPSGIELVFYVATVLSVMTIIRVTKMQASLSKTR